MARKRARIPTTQEINDLYAKGDIESLRRINETLAKRANTRMKALEDKDMEGTYAYNRAKSFIQEYKELGNGVNFSRRKTLDIDDLVLNIKEESNFLRSQTSTASGEQKRRDAIYQTLTTRKISDKQSKYYGQTIISAPEGDKAQQTAFKKKFLDFLDSDTWNEIKKDLYGDTNQTMDEAAEAVKNGASISDLKAAWDNYVKHDISDPETIWDEWRSPKELNR